MSIETLNLIETLLHNELMSAVANKDKNEILKLSAAWLEIATELEKKYYSSVPVEPEATVKVVEDIFGEIRTWKEYNPLNMEIQENDHIRIGGSKQAEIFKEFFWDKSDVDACEYVRCANGRTYTSRRISHIFA